MPLRKSNAIAKKTFKLPASARVPKSSIMSVYRARVSQHAKQTKQLTISQRNVIIGTDDSWINAQVINRDPAWAEIDNADYVWSSRDLNSDVAVVSRRFTLSRRRSILSGSLFLAVDNYAVVLINGRIVVYDAPTNVTANFNPGRQFNIRPYLRSGPNDIVIVAFNAGGPRSPANPAGVAARLNIRLSALQ